MALVSVLLIYILLLAVTDALTRKHTVKRQGIIDPFQYDPLHVFL